MDIEQGYNQTCIGRVNLPGNGGQLAIFFRPSAIKWCRSTLRTNIEGRTDWSHTSWGQLDIFSERRTVYCELVT
jgi:hypothetical protein